MSCGAPSVAFAVAVAEAAAATIAAVIFIYLFAWWRARANYLAGALRDEREANLLHNHHHRGRASDREGEIITPG